MCGSKLPWTMMADGGCDSSTCERSEADESVRDGIECEASASSVMRNSGDQPGDGKNGNRWTAAPLTKAIVQEQQYVGLACQTREAQACAKGLYTLRELRVGYLGQMVPEFGSNGTREERALPWRTTMNEAHRTRA
jgi:hypothetical protein